MGVGVDLIACVRFLGRAGRNRVALGGIFCLFKCNERVTSLPCPRFLPVSSKVYGPCMYISTSWRPFMGGKCYCTELFRFFRNACRDTNKTRCSFYGIDDGRTRCAPPLPRGLYTDRDYWTLRPSLNCPVEHMPFAGTTSIFARRLCAAGPMAHPLRHGGREGESEFHMEAMGGGGGKSRLAVLLRARKVTECAHSCRMPLQVLPLLLCYSLYILFFFLLAASVCRPVLLYSSTVVASSSC